MIIPNTLVVAFPKPIEKRDVALCKAQLLQIGIQGLREVHGMEFLVIMSFQSMSYDKLIIDATDNVYIVFVVLFEHDKVI